MAKRTFKDLQEMMKRDRVEALFGKSPPPPRSPAPYPQGEIISQCNNRFVVRHGNTITKYATYDHGFGANDVPNEALALGFVKANTTIPVPQVISSDWDRITMEYIEGQTLQKAWPTLAENERSNILAQLRDYIAQMRNLDGTLNPIGRLDGRGVVVPSIMMRSGGPFGTMGELHEWLVRPPKRLQAQSIFWQHITAGLGAEYPIVFTHGDLAARNIMVRNGSIVAVLDWEFAGWCPIYWDYVFAMRGLDNVDWETLGSHVPTLFAEPHYNNEYILMQFILSLS